MEICNRYVHTAMLSIRNIIQTLLQMPQKTILTIHTGNLRKRFLVSKMDILQSLKAILIRIKSGLKKTVVSIENGGAGLYLLKQNCQKNFQKELKLFDLTGKMLARVNLSKMITLWKRQLMLCSMKRAILIMLAKSVTELKLKLPSPKH